MSLSLRDQAIIWHPLTQQQTAPLPIAITRGEGSYVVDESGLRYLDLISSWWVNLHGHGHAQLAEAIYRQALTLDHVIFAGFTHEPAVALCEQLRAVLPCALSRFFFSDNGSTCVEVALKMALQYWSNREHTSRRYFLAFEGGYHGDTFGAMAVGAQSGFHDAFKSLLFPVLTFPFPATWDNDETIDVREAAALDAIDQHLMTHGADIAALIVEPLVQGSAGMRMCRPQFLNTVMQRVREQGILVIFDEVMTGFGRTGTLFAADQLELQPDFMCLSKGLTGGTLPLALTVTTDRVYQAFLSDSWHHAFLHSHSYTANPIACAAALASLGLLRQQQTALAQSAIYKAHRCGLSYVEVHCPFVEKIRCLGTIAAFEWQASAKARALFLRECLNVGLLIRPLGACVYLIPPFSVTTEELKHAYQKIVAALNVAVAF